MPSRLMFPGVSVIICCYNSASRLPNTLKCLTEQVVDATLNWEVIVVNNNSSDNTVQVVLEEWNKVPHDVSLSICDEERPGLSFARSAGIKKSKYDVLIFCDDDNWLDKNYVQKAFSIINSSDNYAIVGGRNIATADVELPYWFKQFEEAYACGEQSSKDGEMERQYIYGAGMVIKRSVLNEMDAIGFKSQLSDRKGAELASGGDSELSFMALLLGYKLIYSSSLVLWHHMDANRLSWSYLIKLMEGHARSNYKLGFYLKLLNNEEYSHNWLVELYERTKELVQKDGLRPFYHFFKAKHWVGSLFSVFEKWKIDVLFAHFNMRRDYSKFVSYMHHIKMSTR